MDSEVELKLDLAPEGPPALGESGLLGECRGQELLHAVYFDTPGLHLRRSGISLRIRREGKGLVQGVKASGSSGAGLFARGEWERPVRVWRPLVDDGSPLRAVLGDREAALERAFEVVAHREHFLLSEGASRIAVALDRADARAGSREWRFAELELELISGEPAQLFALARRLDGTAELRVGVLAKADRGFRLRERLADAEKAGSVQLDPDWGPVQACSAIMGECLRHYRLNEDILRRERKTEALHQARVALRRMRSAHALFAPLLQDECSMRLDRAVRRLARTFGRARDLDVLWQADSADETRRRLLAPRRERAWRRVEAAVTDPQMRRLMLDLAEWIALGAWRSAEETAWQRAMPLRDFAAGALDRRLSRLRRHGRHLAELAEEARHQVRKDAKKLRYGVEFLSGLVGPRSSRQRQRTFLAALEKLQENLGALNDIAVERAILGSAAADRSAETERLLRRAGEARHALLQCEPCW